MIALLLCLLAPAQTATEAGRDTYWSLRDRLTDEFLTEGTASGDAIPAVHRNDALSYIKWADGTVQLGWYLAVLATEHAMLADPTAYPRYDASRPSALAANETALHDALAAIDRLDLAGELGYPCPPISALNGFFVRDDVPADHHTHFQNVGLTLSDGTDIALYNKEMSQDQVYHLLLGLALVKQLVPAGTLVSGQDLNAQAISQADRIANKLIAVDGWVLRNPVCDKDVDRGADARAYSGGTVQAVEFVTGTVYSPAGLDAWRFMDNPANPAYLNADNLHMTMVIAAVGEGFGTDTLDVLLDLSAIHDWYAYPMVYAALHDASRHPDWATHQADLVAYARTNLAELGTSDIRSPRPLSANHGWTSWNRYLRPRSDHYAGGDGSEGQRYHGLDWMLVHNLLYVVDPGAWELTGGTTTGTDTGTPGTTTPTGGTTPTGTTPTTPTTDTATEPTDEEVGPGGCACDQGHRPFGALGLVTVMLVATRRRADRSTMSDW